MLAVSFSAHAAHPLLSDDTGTQGQGNWQLELNTDHTRTREGGESVWQRAVGSMLTRGVTDNLDLAVSQPWMQTSGPGQDRERGVGDTTVQAKWRLYDDGQGWSLGVRPSFTLPTGSESKGLGNGRPTAAVALLSTLERGDWTWLANAGYTWNNNVVGDRRHLWSASTAVLYAVAPQWSLAVDVGTSRSADQSVGWEKYGLVGVIYHANKDLDLDFGLRHNLEGGASERTFGAGMTLRWQ